MMKWIRSKLRAAWAQIKRGWFFVLAFLGILTGAVYAESVLFNFIPATERVDGTPMALNEIAETRLYCDGALVLTEQGADGSFDIDLGVGTHTCYATHVDTIGQESDPSNTVTRVVGLPKPNPPASLTDI